MYAQEYNNFNRMKQPKEFIHKNNCPVGVAQRGEWSASISPECNCYKSKKNCPECQFEQEHAFTCSLYKEVPFEISLKENWEQKLLEFCAAEDRASLNELNEWDLRMLAEFIRSNFISREKVEEAIEKIKIKDLKGYNPNKIYSFDEIMDAVAGTRFNTLSDLRQELFGKEEI